MKKRCKYAKCGREFPPNHRNRQYCTENCQRAAANDARRAERALTLTTNCKRCHLDLGLHHGNRDYHPACQEAQEREARQARRASNVDHENEQQRNRYAAKRASNPRIKVKCFYRAKRVHTFNTRDRRIHYCSVEHRKLGQRLLARAADRKEYHANPLESKNKNSNAYTRRMQLAALGKRVAAGEFIPARSIDKITKARIPMAASLQLRGLKPYAMTDSLYPPAHDLPDKEKGADKIRRFGYTKKFLKKHRPRIDQEKKRQSALPEADRTAIAAGADEFIHKHAQTSLGVQPSNPQEIA